MTNEFEKSWRVVADSASAELAASAGGKAYVDRVRTAVDGTVEKIIEVASSLRDVEQDKGFVAEQWHGGTFNIDAARKDLKGVYAEVPRDDGPVDIRTYTPKRVGGYQSKYRRTPKQTADELAKTKYDDLTGKIVPSEQVKDVRKIATKLAGKNQTTKPPLAKSHRHTASQTDDVIKEGGASSRKLDVKSARALTKSARKKGTIDQERYGLTVAQNIKWSDLLKKAGKSGLTAAAISAAISVAPHIAKAILRAITDGTLDLEELGKAGVAGATGAAQGGITGALSAGVTIACQSGKLGAALTNLSPSVISTAVVLAVQTAILAFKAARGEITWRQMAEETSRAAVFITGATVGAAVGQSVIPIPVLGALIGSLVGSIVTAVGYFGIGSVCVTVFRETEWTLFGIVEQDYMIPKDVLKSMHLELLAIDELRVDRLRLDTLRVDRTKLDMLQCRVLRRGVLEFGRFGYV